MSIRFFPDRVPSSKLPLIIAVESLLININAVDAELDVSLGQEDLMSTDDALQLLNAAGFNLAFSSRILATMNY